MSRSTPTGDKCRRPSAASPATWLQLAVAYLIVGVALGVVMGANHDFSLKSVHVHLALMGWTTLALAGVVYSLFPALGTNRLARLHFWLYNLALPPMMLALAAVLLGRAEAVPVLVVSQLVAASGVLAFAVNVFVNLRRAADGEPSSDRSGRRSAAALPGLAEPGH